MKNLNRLSICITLFFTFFVFVLNAQSEEEPTGFPGDHFSLEGALNLFEKAKSPEDFEKQLNTEKNQVNNSVNEMSILRNHEMIFARYH